jgi:outer membrane lipoprotein SlyB
MYSTIVDIFLRPKRERINMKQFTIILMSFVFIVGCAESRSGNVYTRDQARSAMTVLTGKVKDVRQVQIEGTKTPIGPIAGAVGGAAIGSTIGGGSGKTVATVLGGLAGAAGGAVAEEQITKKQGLEITVQLQTGETIAVVQEADEQFAIGEAVRILKGPDGTTRIRH